MRTRAAQKADFEQLRAIYKAAGMSFALPDFNSPMIEANEVVVDENDQVIVGGMARRTAEIFLLCRPGFHPMVKMEAIGMLHSQIRDTIVPKGYTEGFAFIQPEFERFGWHLTQRFGWEKTWSAYRILDWKSEIRKEG